MTTPMPTPTRIPRTPRSARVYAALVALAAALFIPACHTFYGVLTDIESLSDQITGRTTVNALSD